MYIINHGRAILAQLRHNRRQRLAALWAMSIKTGVKKVEVKHYD